MGYLIDSNVLIDYIANRFTRQQLLQMDGIFDNELNLSVITRIENLGFNSPAEEAQKMKLFLQMANIIPLHEEVVQKTIEIRKLVKIKTPDAIIAATSLVSGYTLLSRNIPDFIKVPGLDIADPHSW